MIKNIKKIFSGLLYSLMIYLPDEFTSVRVRYFNSRGCKIHRYTSICSNVRIRGKIEMGYGSSIAQNCSIGAENSGVFIGENVMIAPNVVIVDFNHGYYSLETPMVEQRNIIAPVFIEDDVWIASNCTIGKGVRIGKGAIISANSLVIKDVEPFSIVRGVPAEIIKYRN